MIIDRELDDAMSTIQVFLVVVLVTLSTTVLGIGCVCTYRFLVPLKEYGTFLCHHKEGAAIFARWFKLALRERSNDRVFLDVDYLDRLDKIFGCVRDNTKNLVILLTRETLYRIWCAGEVASGILYNVPTIPVACEDWVEPSDEKLVELNTIWTKGQKSQVASLGVEVSMIQEAYVKLRQFSKVDFKRNTCDEISLHNSFVQVYEGCTGLSKSAVGQFRFNHTGNSDSLDKIPILLLGNTSDPEAMMLCFVLQRLLQTKLQIAVQVAAKDLDASKSQIARAACIVPTLTRGVLEDQCFSAQIVACCSSGGKEIVPVCADLTFKYPDNEFWAKLDAGQVIDAENVKFHLGAPYTLQTIHLAYKVLFNILAIRFEVSDADLKKLAQKPSAMASMAVEQKTDSE